MQKKYSLGIDLGTSNSCLALCDPAGGRPEGIVITQVMAPGVIGDQLLLPSTLYLPLENEGAQGELALPWDGDEDPTAVVGVYARERGSLAPDRVVTSAKSWLCNPHVDRYAPILPWQSELTEDKLSPFETTRRYLEHLRRAAEAALSERDAELSECLVVLTVPASFDEVARTLTFDAAVAAGLGQVTLLEEPQAAFYAWIAESEARKLPAHWTTQVRAGDLVLVCDVGGGTADFSLIAVAASEAGLSQQLDLHRIAVGEHILLGGDNMDLALAYALKEQLASEGKEIDHWQFLALVHAARAAKERLLSDPDLDAIPIAVPSRGASLFAKTVTTTLARERAESLILEGYFPHTAVTDVPRARRSVGLQEYGLEYATEPALSKHLARFLSRARDNVRSDERLRSLVGAGADLDDSPILWPTALLFNGGVFHSGLLRRRVTDLLRSWLGADHPLTEIESVGLDKAVANGAAYYGAVQLSGRGIKIRAGTSRSYYLGIESPMPAVPGITPPVKAVCIVPQGTEEGTALELPGREFGLVTGEPVEFRFFSSEVRAGDRVGTLVADAPGALDETAGLAITLPPIAGQPGQVLPVTLKPLVTEVGTLELWMSHTRSEEQWKLEFNLRAKD